ncbi:SDR family NAD(P)-dependent oxidoreductase [Oceanicella sp. SM1341]|uniref:SDR family NAD(P)-dependent oxidoreductase n=1 Tax=Oceanicella sp. SM1341 TaxID=1548889 RepID=UPI000E469353|nr:SDR family oxidoreductase [Oceanicella sp. SM1341]
MTGRLAGKVALVTGGSSGIGEAIATRFAAEGARVIVLGRRQAGLDAVVERIGGGSVGMAADVTDAASLRQVFAAAHDQHGGIDILVPNAGFGSHAPLGRIEPDRIDSQFATNVRGVILTVQEALPLLRAGSSVVIIGSSASIDPGPGMSVYGATKAALRALLRGWLQDVRGRDIRFNILSPGPTRTQSLVDGFGDEAEAGLRWLTQRSPIGRIGEPEEIAAAALFLAGSDSSYVNGIELFVDGGASQC